MADHKVTVHRVGDILVCDPPETIAKKGDTITWTGPAEGPGHTGLFLGRLHDQRKKSGFTKSDLADHNVEAGRHPVRNPSWVNGETVHIPADAHPGAYSYMVEIDLGDRKIQSDPIVIIDDGGTGGGS